MVKFHDTYVPSGDLVVSAGDRNWFLSDLAKQHHGMPIHIRSEGPISGEVHSCHLSQIRSSANSIVFEMECDHDSETRYAIANPQRVTAHRNASGITESLTIVALDGSVTTAWFGEAANNWREPDALAA